MEARPRVHSAEHLPQAPHACEHDRLIPRRQHHDGTAHLRHGVLEGIRPHLGVVLSLVAVEPLVLVDREAVDPEEHLLCLVRRQRAHKVLQRVDRVQGLVRVRVRHERCWRADEMRSLRVGGELRAQRVRLRRRLGASVRPCALLPTGVLDIVVRVPAIRGVGHLWPALRPARGHCHRQNVCLEEVAGRSFRRDPIRVRNNVLERVEDAGEGDAGALAVLA